MRLYCKHLLRTLWARPLQPLILVFTILLSVTVFLVSLGIGDALEEERELGRAASYGSADITVRLGAGSSTRFLFAEEAKALLGEDSRVVGLYELPLLCGEASVSGAAAELARYGDVFPLRFTAYGEITEGALPRVVLISHSFARRMGLSVGDTLTVTLLNRKQDFTIQGIAADRFAGEHDVLFDVSAVTRRIAEDSLFLSVLGEDFRPAGALYIKVGGSLTKEEALARLAASPTFSDKTLLDVEHHVGTLSSTESAAMIVNMIILFTGLLSVAVTFSSFVILASERREENAVFAAAGARQGRMQLLLYAEVLLLYAVGTPLGLLFGRPALRLLVRLAGLSYAKGELDTRALLTAALLELAALLLTVTLFLLLHRERARRAAGVPLFLLPLCPLLLLFPFAFFASAQLRFPLGIAMLVLLLLVAAVATPPLLRRCMQALVAREERRGGTRQARLYAAANTRSVPLLGNVTALLALLLSVLVITLTVIASSHGFLYGARTLFSGEHVIPGATERAAERVLALPTVDRASGIYLATAEGEEGSYTAVSADELSSLAPHLSIRQLPRGEEAVLSREIALSLSLSVGDTLSLTVEGKPLTLTVSEIVRTGMPMILFDAPSHGIPYNMLLVSGRAGVSGELLLQELTEATASELTGILPTEGLLEIKTATFSVYIRTALILLFVLLLFSAVGLTNNLLQSYRERREELLLYAVSGMPPLTLRRMKALEVAGVLLFGLLIALAAAVLSLPLMQLTLGATHDFFLNLFKPLIG